MWEIKMKSNYNNVYEFKNEPEMKRPLNWLESLSIDLKISHSCRDIPFIFFHE